MEFALLPNADDDAYEDDDNNEFYFRNTVGHLHDICFDYKQRRRILQMLDWTSYYAWQFANVHGPDRISFRTS